jgi:hypothetical protein
VTGKREGPVDRVFIKDSSRESNELIQLKGELNDRSCEQGTQGGVVMYSWHQVVSEPDYCLYISGEGGVRDKEHSDTQRQVVSDLELFLYISSRGGRQSTGILCGDWLQVGDNQEGSQGDCRRMKLETLLVWSDNGRFARKVDRDNTMVTEDHRHAGKKSKEKKIAEMDKELYEIRADIEKLELKMQQKAKPRWVYEWPMKESKAKWPLKKLMARRQHRLLREWLRYVENLNGPEKMVQVCEPETGINLSELGSAEDLRDYQEDIQGISHCQLGNDMRSLRDLIDC